MTEIDEEAEPRETKGERTKRRLLEVAIQRFGEKGFRGTSVSAIAREVGITQAAVYAYYESKTDLFDAAVDADAEAVIAYAQQRAGDADPQALIPALLVHASIAMAEHPLVRRVLRGEEPEALTRLINLPGLSDFTRWLAVTVEQAQLARTVRTDIDPESWAEGAETVILALLLGIEQMSNEIEEHRQLAVGRFFVDALRPAPGADGDGSAAPD